MDKLNSQNVEDMGGENPFEGMSRQEIDELMQVFFEDGREQLERLAEIALLLEKGDYTQKDLHDLYRVFHSFKGSAGSFGFKAISHLAHRLEEILEPVRQESMPITETLVSLVLHALDQFQMIFQKIQEDKPYEQLIASLSERIELYIASLKAGKSDTVARASMETGLHADLEKEFARREESIRIKLRKINRLIDLSSEMAMRKNYGQVTIPKITQILERVRDEKDSLTQTAEKVANASEALKSIPGINEILRKRIQEFDSIDADLKILLEDFSRWYFQLNILAEELRYETLMTRMFPFSWFMRQFRRLIRELELSLNKKIELEILGDALEVDRHILEILKDPLIHLIRNAASHGIEAAEIREERGKSPEGHIRIAAWQEGNRIHIDVSDDGSGINADLIREQVPLRMPGKYSMEQLKAMSSNDLMQLIFLPGFSTSGEISEVSGRGVGLDVVQTNVKELRGHISVSSVANIGTTFHISIPSSMTISSVLVFAIGMFTFAIELSNVDRAVVIDRRLINDSSKHIMLQYKRWEYPVVRLADFLGMPADRPNAAMTNILLCRSEGSPVALLVDEFFDIQEIVVRPLRLRIEEAKYFSGITFLPDGTLAFILDPRSISSHIEETGLDSSHESVDVISVKDTFSDEFQAGVPMPLVPVRTGEKLIGIPGHWVLRQFKISRPGRKSASSRRNIMFGGRKIPLYLLAEFVGISSTLDTPEVILLLCRIEGRLLALEVDSVLPRQEGLVSGHFGATPAMGSFEATLMNGSTMEVLLADCFAPNMDENGGKHTPPVETDIKRNTLVSETGDLSLSHKNGVYLISFHAGNHVMGIAFDAIQEIMPSAPMQRFDGDALNPEGFVNLRGECIEVFDLRIWLMGSRDLCEKNEKLIVVVKDNARRGLIVDSINVDVECLEDQRMLNLPESVSPYYPCIYTLS